MNIGSDNMLTKFSVENFRNFKEKLSIDFKQEHDYKFNTECVNNKIISKIVVFGNNGEGKSNFGFAMFDIVRTITDLFVDTGAYDVKNFLNADSDLDYAEFNYEFKFGEDVIKYNYKKSNVTTLKSEELIINNELIYKFDFEKKDGEFNLSRIGAETLNIDKENIKISILKFISNNTVQKEDSVISKLIEFVKHMIWFRSLGANAFIGFETDVDELNEWIVKNNLTKDFEEFLRNMAKVNMNLTSAKIGNSEFLLDKHKKRAIIFNDIASSGTKSLQLFYYWSKRFEKASLVFIDEFDAFYHFELSENVIKLLLKYKNMQAILTSHNTNLADNKLMRPDCYYILKSGKIKSFVDSTQRELREGHNLSKMLKEGEFDE